MAGNSPSGNNSPGTGRNSPVSPAAKNSPIGGNSPASSSATPDTTGLRIWLKADAGVSSSGGAISAWVDQQSSVSYAAAGTVAPQAIAASLNGLPVVRLSNSGGDPQSCYLSASINPSTWAGITVVYVLRTASSGSIPLYNSVLGWHSGGTWWTFNCGSANNTTNNQGIGWAGAIGSVVLGSPATPPGNSQIVFQAYQYEKTTWTMSGLFAGTKADTSFPTGAVTAWIGTNDLTGTQSTSDLAEILIYDRAITTSALAATRAYLTGRWGSP